MGDKEGCDPEEELEDTPISSSAEGQEGRRERLRIIMSPTPKVQMQRSIITSTMDNSVNMKTFYRQQFQAGGIQCLSCGVKVPIPTQFNLKLLSILKKLVFQPAFLKRVNSSVNFKKNPSSSPFQSESHWVEYLCTSFCASCASELNNMVQLQMEIERLQSRLDTMSLGLQDLIWDSVHPPQILGHPDNDDDMDEDEQEISSLTLRSPIHTDRANDPKEEEDMISSDFEVYVPSEVEIENADTDSEDQVVHVPNKRKRSSRAATARGSDQLKIKDRESVKKVFREQPHSCPFCSKRFGNETYCTRHVRRKHHSQYKRVRRETTAEEETLTEEEIVKELSHLISLSKSQNKLLKKTEQEDKSSLAIKFKCDESTSTNESEDTVWTCTICTNTLKSRRQLEKHIDCCHRSVERSDWRSGSVVADRFITLSLGVKSQPRRKSKHKFGGDKNTQSKFVLCPTCGKTIAAVSFKDHEKRMHLQEYAFKCDKCNRGISSKANFEEHMQLHTALEDIGAWPKARGPTTLSEDTNLCCSLCHRSSFQDLSSLFTHQVSQHANLLTHRFLCTFCGKAFLSSVTLKQHERGIHPQPPHSNNNDTLALSDPDVSSTFHKTEPKPDHATYRCILCSTVFSTMIAFRVHAKQCPFATEGSRKKQCLLCGELFQKVRDKEEHFRRVHRGLETYKCPHCPLKFPRPDVMIEHARVHTGDKPIDCDKCGKAFSTVKAMRRHQVHYCALDEEQRERVRETMRQSDKKWRQRAKQVFCPFCRKGYIETGHLNEHIKKHHLQ